MDFEHVTVGDALVSPDLWGLILLAVALAYAFNSIKKRLKTKERLEDHLVGGEKVLWDEYLEREDFKEQSAKKAHEQSAPWLFFTIMFFSGAWGFYISSQGMIAAALPPLLLCSYILAKFIDAIENPRAIREKKRFVRYVLTDRRLLVLYGGMENKSIWYEDMHYSVKVKRSGKVRITYRGVPPIARGPKIALYYLYVDDLKGFLKAFMTAAPKRNKRLKFKVHGKKEKPGKTKVISE